MMAKTYYVYILTNKNHTVLYTGITNDLSKRMWEHQAGLGSKFADRYRAIELVYFEVFEDPYEAISREKQIKAGPRRRKVALIRKLNPRWRNLAEDFEEVITPGLGHAARPPETASPFARAPSA